MAFKSLVEYQRKRKRDRISHLQEFYEKSCSIKKKTKAEKFTEKHFCLVCSIKGAGPQIATFLKDSATCLCL